VQDQQQLLELLGKSFGHSAVLGRNGAAIDAALASAAAQPWAETGQPIRNMVKDVAIVGEARCVHPASHCACCCRCHVVSMWSAAFAQARPASTCR
jgi:hypothetical protein